MKIIKFNESLEKEEIDDILLDLKDLDNIEVDSQIRANFLLVYGTVYGEFNIDFLSELVKISKRIVSLGYTSVDKYTVLSTSNNNGKKQFDFELKFESVEKKSVNLDINSYKSFKDYMENNLGIPEYEECEYYIPDLATGPICLLVQVNLNQDRFMICVERGNFTSYEDFPQIFNFVMKNSEFKAYWQESWEENEKLAPILRSKIFEFNNDSIKMIENLIREIESIN